VDVQEGAAAVGRARLVEEGNAADDDHQQQRQAHAEDDPEPLAREQLQLGESEPPEGRTPFGRGQGCDGNGHFRVPLVQFRASSECSGCRPVSARNASSRLAWSTRSWWATIWLRASTEVTAFSALSLPVTTTTSPLRMTWVTSGR